ncbi:hypothetical protein O7626_19740 [Micromonospora sp. WMMD1102]|uniref:hypothetical protein n=1 Tax=Micromonospora sp. WMMD1102 TaxID=3016105 RepID=UPI002415796B|nr:hypothetical protein [Micromonospora sp. WMMD1102]MDG4788141.1 hypothetical protein [Micromonospora sp. WMMD1102]
MPAGTVLELAKEDWRYGGHPLRLRVEFVRLDLSTYYDNQWVWISGQRLAQDGSPLGHLDALVRVSALPCPGGESGNPPCPGGESGNGAGPVDSGSRTAGRNGSARRTAPRQRTRQGPGRRSVNVDRDPDPGDEPPPERPGGEQHEQRSRR